MLFSSLLFYILFPPVYFDPPLIMNLRVIRSKHCCSFLTQVLSVNPDRRRLLLTHKKTLVTSHLQIITEYNDCTKPGTSAHGFITAIKEYGCIVTFYNNVKGLVPRTQLGFVMI